MRRGTQARSMRRGPPGLQVCTIGLAVRCAAGAIMCSSHAYAGTTYLTTATLNWAP